ncbi:hypothetical protein C8Q73DRAFT_791134 [Cubamyces lactineus]|nr:hypothetical protein C8Q73DRAFT_791134 [Cubamyces lactineus]
MKAAREHQFHRTVNLPCRDANLLHVGARGTNTGLPPQTQRESAQERARTSLASASALLLSDLQRPPTTAPSAGASIRPDDEVPRPAKRRRLTPIAGSSQTLFEASASTNPTPLPAAVNDHDSLPSEHRDYAPSLADSGAKSRTASTHAAPPQAPAIKRECSASPALDADVPHLVTEGCVRIAPLPPECKAGRAGYQNARREWTTREAKKLRELGLKPTRVFIREDGMVIDWRSDIPVMSDTLRPPSAEDAIAQVQPSAPAQGIGLGAGSSIAPAGPRGSQGQSCPSNHQGAGQPPPAALEALVSNNTQASSSTMQRQPLPPVPRTLVSPAPGETIWTRVLPPRQAPPLPPPLPLSADVARTATPSASRGPATNIERYDRHRHRPQPATTTATTRQQISPDVEIIDLTEEAGYDDSRSQGRSALSFVDRPRISAALREQPAAGTPPTSNTDATPGSIMDTDEMQRGAVAFLERSVLPFMILLLPVDLHCVWFLAGYNSDRSALASAYSRVATFSVQTVSSPRTRTHTAASSSLVDALTAAALGCAPSNPIDVDASDTPAESGSRSHPSPYPPTIHRQGRVDIIAALLDLPPLDVGNEVSDSNSDSDPDSGSAKLTVEWDLVHAPEAGDVLLICYAVATLAKRKAKRSRMEKDGHRDMEREKRTRDKGKGKATDRPASRADTASGARRGRMCIYEQRFLLRPREWDEEDR